MDINNELKIVDARLKDEIDLINERYQSLGLMDSPDRLNDINRAQVKADDARKLLVWQAERDRQRQKPHLSNKLVVYTNGKIQYYSKSGKKYDDEFGKDTNNLRLINLLALHPNSLISADEIEKTFKPPKHSADDPLPDRRVRDAIGYIKKKLGLNTESNFFVVNNKHYGIYCDVEFKE